MNYHDFWEIVKSAQVTSALVLIAAFLAILVARKDSKRSHKSSK